MTSAKISVVIPVHNEEQQIGAILTRLQAVADFHEIIVVDDGSLDCTAQTIASFGDVRLISHPYNLGNGAAVKTGLRAATGDVIVLMDGDGQHPPEDIPHLLEHIGRYDMVVGARSKGSESWWYRDLANRVFNAYASYIAGYRVHDLTSGFRALRADVAKRFIGLLPNGFSYPSTLTIALFRSGYTVRYQPFVSPRRVGKSKIRLFRDGVRFLLTLTRLAVLFVPLKIFLPVSVVLLVIGGGYVALSLIVLHRFSGFGGLIFSVGALIFLLGLISEQIALVRFMKYDR